MLFKFILSILIIYGLLTGILFATQRKLIYFPTQSLPREELLQAENLKSWHSANNSYRGFISTQPKNNNIEGTIIIFHGNAGTADRRIYYTRALTVKGYRVLLVEYPGYGQRKGKPSETLFVNDGREIVKSIYKQFKNPIYLWGESLGSGVVAAIVADSNLPVAGIVLITPWDTLANLAQTIYWYLPVGWLLLDKFDSVNNLQAFKGKVAVLIAEKDEIIPPQFSMNLYDSLTGEKKLWILNNAGHNSLSIYPQATWWQEVIHFLEE
jgi:uncharacterized protein